MQTVVVHLKISPEEYLKHYQVAGAVVSTQSADGRSVQFPAQLLQRYVTRQGISGSYRISFDDSGKFKAIEQLSG